MAFDTIYHGLLLERQGLLRVKEYHDFLVLLLLDWIIPEVVTNELLLHPTAFMVWGSAGFHLVPMQFNSYTNLLKEIIRGTAVMSHQYVDDIQFYFFITAESYGSVEVLNKCLQMAMGWIRTNKLKFSPDRTEVLLVIDKASQGLRSQVALLSFKGTGS